MEWSSVSALCWACVDQDYIPLYVCITGGSKTNFHSSHQTLAGESEQEWEIVAGNKTFYSRQPQPPYIKQNNSIITFNLLQQEYTIHSTLENWSLFSLCLQSPPCLQSTNSQCWLPAEVNFQIVYWSWLSDERGIDDGGGIIIHLLHALHDHW